MALRSLQSVIREATGVEVPLLNLSQALMHHMASKPCLSFSRATIESYYARLRNWQLADQTVMHRFHAIRRERRATAEDIQEIYEIYRVEAEAQGLVPLGYQTFRMRAYQIPVPRRRSAWDLQPR
jgi:hypothetical protein